MSAYGFKTQLKWQMLVNNSIVSWFFSGFLRKQGVPVTFVTDWAPHVSDSISEVQLLHRVPPAVCQLSVWHRASLVSFKISTTLGARSPYKTWRGEFLWNRFKDWYKTLGMGETGLMFSISTHHETSHFSPSIPLETHVILQVLTVWSPHRDGVVLVEGHIHVLPRARAILGRLISSVLKINSAWMIVSSIHIDWSILIDPLSLSASLSLSLPGVPEDSITTGVLEPLRCEQPIPFEIRAQTSNNIS